LPVVLVKRKKSRDKGFQKMLKKRRKAGFFTLLTLHINDKCRFGGIKGELKKFVQNSKSFASGAMIMCTY